jgi:hypothetical protein
MIALDTADKLLEAFLGEAVSDNDLPVAVTYSDFGNVDSEVDSIGKNVLLTGTSPVTVVAADFGGDQRVDFITISNADTIPHAVTFRINDGVVTTVVGQFTLQPGESRNYVDGNWQTYDSEGVPKSDVPDHQGLWKTLAQATVTNSESTVYTVPANTQVKITHMRAVNSFAGLNTFRMEHDGIPILPAAEIVTGGWAEWDGEMFLDAGGVLSAQAGSNSVILTIYGITRDA